MTFDDHAMRSRCAAAAEMLKLPPACNIVPLFTVYHALERSRPGVEPTVDELVRAYRCDTDPGAAT